MTIPTLLFGPLLRGVPLQLWTEIDPFFVRVGFVPPGSIPARPVHPKTLRALLQSGDATLVRLVQSPYSFCTGWDLTPGAPAPEPSVASTAHGVLTTGGTGGDAYSIFAFWDNRSSALPLSCSVYLLPGTAASTAEAATLADAAFASDYGGGGHSTTASGYLIGLSA